MPLTARLVGVTALVALASAGVSGVLTARSSAATDEQAVATAARADLAALTAVVTARDLPDADAAADDRVVVAVRARLRLRGVGTAVLDPAGTTGAAAPFTAADVRTTARTGELALTRGAWFVVGQDTTDQGTGTAQGLVVLVAEPYTAAHTLDALQRRRLLLGVVAGLLAGAAAGAALAAGITRPVRAAAAAARRVAAGARDVPVPVGGAPELADLAGALDLLQGELRTAEARRRQFLADVAHELRTPLTAVLGHAEELAEGVLDPADAAAAGQVVHAEALRLRSRVDDLLTLARLEADRFEVTCTTVDVVQVVRSAVLAATPRATRAGVVLTVEVPGPVPTASADAERLRQVVDALVDNALRLLVAGRPLVVAAHAGRRPGTVELQVRDGGPGLATADLADAFAPGALAARYRGRRAVGSGLGLALVAALTRRMGGEVEAGHAPEGGAAFTITLPVAPLAPGAGTGPGPHQA